MTVRAALPDLDTLNHEALKALILTQHQILTAQEEEIFLQRTQLHSQDAQLAWRQAEIERLQLLIAKLRRMQFGRRSEKLERQIEQLELQLDELETAQVEKPVAAPTPGAARQAGDSGKPARRPLPAHLPRQERRILPKEVACPACVPTGRDLCAGRCGTGTLDPRRTGWAARASYWRRWWRRYGVT
jgi:transposase